MNSPFAVRQIWLVLFLLSSISLSAQQAVEPQKPAGSQASSSNPAAPGNTFRSRAELVLVPVVVRGNKGKHVTGLSKDMFHLEENGKEQDISLFEEVLPPNGDVVPSAALDRGYSNLPFDNARQLRLTIMVLDLLNTSPLQRTDGKDQLVKFLSKSLVPNQPVSLLCITGKGLKLVLPFTTDTNALITALKKTPPGPPTVAPRRDVVISTFRQIGEIAQAYAGIPGRKTMIFAAGYLPELATEHEMYESSVLSDDLRRMWKGLIDANISVYPFQIMAWANDPTLGGLRGRPTDLMLRDFAESTGGNRCLESNDLNGCLAQAVEDSRAYYMLGFSVRPDDRKPGWRDLKTKVSAEHVDVRARNGFYYGAASDSNPKAVHDEELNALASPVAYSALPMYVKPLPQPSSSLPLTPVASSNKSTVAFMMTIPLSSVRIDPSESNPLDLDIGAIALTSDTHEAAEFHHPVHGNPDAEHLQQWTREGIKLQEKLDLPPGSYDIRFFVRDNNAGQIGTVVFPLDVK